MSALTWHPAPRPALTWLGAAPPRNHRLVWLAEAEAESGTEQIREELREEAQERKLSLTEKVAVVGVVLSVVALVLQWYQVRLWRESIEKGVPTQ